MRDPNTLAEIAAGQAGVVARAQALACGLDDDAIGRRLRGGQWTRPYPGVYATFSGPLSRAAAQWAAVLYAGRGAMLSHVSAAGAAGLCEDGGETIHVTVPIDRHVAPAPGLVVHRSRRAAQRRHPTRLPPQTRLEETVLDLVESARDADEAVGWVTRAGARRLTTPARLRAAVAARARLRRRREVLAALDDSAAGCHSLLEVRYAREVERRHGLPAARRQRARSRHGGRWYDDVHYEAHATTVELDGRAAHPDDSRWRDMARDNAAVATGESVLRYGMADVTERPCAVAAQVVTVLWRNGWRGIPSPCGPACEVGRLIEAIHSRKTGSESPR